MKIIRNTDIWTKHAEGHWIVVTTNTVVKRNGLAVMGAGIAKAAADKFPELPARYGRYLLSTPSWIGNGPVEMIPRLYLFPTKYNWRDLSDLELIRSNAEQLMRLNYHRVHRQPETNPSVYLPALGCGMGGLDPDEVVRAVSPILDDNFTMILYDQP